MPGCDECKNPAQNDNFKVAQHLVSLKLSIKYFYLISVFEILFFTPIITTKQRLGTIKEIFTKIVSSKYMQPSMRTEA